jgi:predicted RNA-binding Zn-ribbon protein involved in translation (DUF1610 family)
MLQPTQKMTAIKPTQKMDAIDNKKAYACPLCGGEGSVDAYVEDGGTWYACPLCGGEGSVDAAFVEDRRSDIWTGR